MKWASLQPFGKWALLGVAISGIVMAMGSDEEPAQARTRGAKMRQAATTSSRPVEAVKHASVMERVELERLPRQKQPPDGDKEVGNAFSVISWYVPPPPPPPLPPLPPAKPVAPPLPFVYLGHYKNADSSKRIIILGGADRVYTVSEGDVIDGTYRVGPATAGMLEFTYLPLDVKQSLSMDMSS